MTHLIEKISIDRLAYELRTLSPLDVERLFDRLSSGELEDFFAVAFSHEICRANDLQEMLYDAEAETAKAEERCEDLEAEVSDLKDELREITADRDFLQGRIHQLTGETFDE